MKSTSETGHAKNVANFQTLIEFVTAYGDIYNPTKKSLQLTQIINLKSDADNKMADTLTKKTQYNGRVNERINTFSNLRPLATRLVNALQSTDATPQTIANAKTYNRKIQGKKASGPQPQTDPDAPVPNTISTSQQSYDLLIEHFAGLRSVLENEHSYAPNETDLQITSIETKTTDLKAKNTAVANAHTAVSNARIARNQTLYTKKDSLFETAGEVKNYIKSVFGATSPQFAQVKGIEFKKPKLRK